MALCNILQRLVSLIYHRFYRRKLRFVVYLIWLFTSISVLLYLLLLRRSDPLHYTEISVNGGGDYSKTRNIALIFAHPDDETLFFSPTIMEILSRKSYPATNLHMLTLSTGDNYGKGRIRAREQQKACKVFRQQIALANPVGSKNSITCYVKDYLHDNPSEKWESSTVLKEIFTWMEGKDISAIITFDQGGNSGHLNHIAIYDAMRVAVKDKLLEIPIYFLYTTTLIRKYSFLYDLPITYMSSFLPWNGGSRDEALVLNSVAQWRCAVRAFKEHKSQQSWDRVLYLGLNRYMWINTLHRLSVES